MYRIPFFLSLAILKYFLYDYKGNRNDSVLTQNFKNNYNKSKHQIVINPFYREGDKNEKVFLIFMLYAFN